MMPNKCIFVYIYIQEILDILLILLKIGKVTNIWLWMQTKRHYRLPKAGSMVCPLMHKDVGSCQYFGLIDECADLEDAKTNNMINPRSMIIAENITRKHG